MQCISLDILMYICMCMCSNQPIEPALVSILRNFLAGCDAVDRGKKHSSFDSRYVCVSQKSITVDGKKCVKVFDCYSFSNLANGAQVEKMIWLVSGELSMCTFISRGLVNKRVLRLHLDIIECHLCQNLFV